MSLDALRNVLDTLPDPSFVEGTSKLSEPLAIMLPDGDVGALEDKTFVAWLLEHAEDAPFGDKGETKLDNKVRNAKRLTARGKAQITGFDPSTVLPAIEDALSPRFHLDARLEDVIVYDTGGKFARHKDTPRTANLVGTLVVGLPIAHAGGAFTITDAGENKKFNWGKPARGTLRWVALFSDLDHAVEPVKSGARVTLVYSLSRSDRPRAGKDPVAKLRDAVGKLKIEKGQPLMIACTRQIITDGAQPQSIATLRGADSQIADVLVEAGFDVAVRACIAGDDSEGKPSGFPSIPYAITRLSRAIPETVFAGADDLVSFTDGVDADEYGDEDVVGTLLGKYIHDYVELERWIIRKRAAATAVYEGLYSETGYFGNEASIGHLYTLAAIEVSAPKAKKAPAKKTKPAKKATKKKQ